MPRTKSLRQTLTLALFLATSVAGLARPQEAPAGRPDSPRTEPGRGGQERRAEREPAEATLPAAWSTALAWRSIGPATMGGRITAIAPSTTDPFRYYVATASGGLLRTTNDGMSFDHLFDKEAVVSIGDVAVAPSNHDIVWVGTGESNPRNSVSWGNGVYKSVDGGGSWKQVGLDTSFQIGRIVIHPQNPDIVYVGALGRLWGPGGDRGLFKTTDGGQTWQRILGVDDATGVIEVKMHPTDPETLLVATWQRRRDGFDGNDPITKWGPGSGLWKTTDGGKSWRRITNGLPTGQLGRIGLDYFAKDPNVVYMVLESERLGMLPPKAGWLGLRAEDVEAGAKIQRVTRDGPAEKAGLAANDVVIALGDERILSADDLVAAARRREVDTKVQLTFRREKETKTVEVTLGKEPARPEAEGRRGAPAADAEPGEVGEASNEVPRPLGNSLGGQEPNFQHHQAKDGHEYGGVYRSNDGGESWTRVNSLNPRPMYFSQIRVNPADDQKLWVLGVELYRSKDGGKTFTSDGGRGTHADHHALWIDPREPRRMVLGNDGGIYASRDAGESWDHLNHVAIGQFYHVELDSRRDWKAYGGLQDNGSWGGPGRVRDATGPMNEDWFRIGSGDGFVCRVDPDDPDQVYFTSQNGGLGRRHLGSGERGSIRPEGSGQGGGRGGAAADARAPRYRFNWNTPYVLSRHNTRIYYVAGNVVFRSLDRGRSLRRISDEITRTKQGSGTQVAESPFDPEVLYVGTDDGALWRTKDGGRTWQDLFPVGEKAAAAGESTATPAPASTPPSAETKPPPATPPTEAVGAAPAATPVAAAAPGGAPVPATATPPAGGTAPESGPPGAGPASGGGESAIARLLERDANKDGKLQKEELSERMQAMFERADTDHSGALEASEIEALARRPGGRRPRGGGEGRGAEGPAPATDPSRPTDVARPADAASSAAAAPPATTGTRTPPANAEGKPLAELVKSPRWVSTLLCSRFVRDRVYLTLDGHRSDDDALYVFVSEDGGDTWRSLVANLPASAGSVRTLAEDLVNRNLLYLGTEFGAWVSLDRGRSWAKLGVGLPTVAVHAFAQHPSSGEIVAATHGRSLWVLDVTPLRQMDADALGAAARLYKPAPAIIWRSQPSRGGTNRRFAGQNPPTGAQILYSLATPAREVSLEIRDTAGNVLRNLDAKTEAALHVVAWDLRRNPRTPPAGEGGATGPGRGGGFRGGRAGRIEPGLYKVLLTVDGVTVTQDLLIEIDPDFPRGPWLDGGGFFGGEGDDEEEDAEAEEHRGLSKSVQDG